MSKKKQKKADQQGDDWQKVDARVLGQILAAQNVVFALPDPAHIAEFYAQTLLSIPGIIACRVCLGDQSTEAWGIENSPCVECEAARRGSKQGTVIPADANFKCSLTGQPDVQVIAIDSYQHHFGFFVFKIDNAAGFDAYQPFISNLSNYVAITFENRLQKELLQNAHHELERRVEERTRDLTAANEELQREIAERTRTEEALRQSQEQVKQLIDASPVAMLVSSGGDERVEWVNDKFTELFGYTTEDMPDVEHWWPLAYPDETYRAKIKAQWEADTEEAIREKSQIKPMEATVKCKDGSYRYVEFRLSSIGQKHIVTFVDLTERKQMEEALSASEAELRTLINAMTDIIFVGNSEGRYLKIVETNPSLLYKPSKELLGKTLHEVFPKDLADFFLNHLRQALNTHTSVNFEYSLPIGDRKLWFYATVSPLTDDTILMVARDITDRKQAEDELRQNREVTQQFSEQLAALQEVTNELSKAESSDDLCLQAVKLGRSRMGFDRVSIWFIEEHLGIMRGSFGTDEHGELRDERNAQVEFRHEGLGWLLFSHKSQMALVEHLPLYDHQGREVGEGDNALAALWDGGEVIGVISVDNLFTGQPIEEHQLEVLRLYATTLGHLITRKRAEEALRASENRFRVLSENAFVGIYIIQDGRLSYVNSTLAKIFGYTPEELTGAEPALVIHPDDQAMVSENIRRRIDGEIEVVHYEFRGRCKDGGIKNIEVLGGRIDFGGKTAVIGNLMDITDRKRAQEEIERSLAAEKKARRVAEILRQANESLSRTLHLDDVLQNLLQYLLQLVPFDSASVMLREGEFQLRVVALSGYEHWTDLDAAQHLVFDIRTTPSLNEVVTTQKSLMIENTYEYPGWLRVPGTEHVVSWLGVPVIADGQVIGLYSVDKTEPSFFTIEQRLLAEGLAAQAAVAIQNTRLHDQITRANVELEQRVASRTAQLEEANKELEAFAYSVSHDLRAPLRHIDGFIDLMQKRTKATLDEKSQHYMDVIADSAQQMGILIDDLLSFSRMGRNEMFRSQVDLNELVQDVIRESKPETMGRKIEWQIGQLPEIAGDRAMLRMVLVNLVSNALKFTRPREVARIEIRCEGNGETETIILVRDNGVGFDMNYADKLFGVFQRLHRQEDFEGTGIGLANVRRIISRHGGRTWADGDVDHGATFYFSLPISK